MRSVRAATKHNLRTIARRGKPGTQRAAGKSGPRVTSGLTTIRKLSRGIENLRRGGTPHANKFSTFPGRSPPGTPGGGVACPRDSGGYAGQANLAYPACAKFVNLFVGEVEEMNVDRRRVGVYRHHIVGQITV